MGHVEDEAELHAECAATEGKSSDSYSLISALALLKLEQGESEEAQALHGGLTVLHEEGLNETAKEVSNSGSAVKLAALSHDVHQHASTESEAFANHLPSAASLHVTSNKLAAEEEEQEEEEDWEHSWEQGLKQLQSTRNPACSVAATSSPSNSSKPAHNPGLVAAASSYTEGTLSATVTLAVPVQGRQLVTASPSWRERAEAEHSASRAAAFLEHVVEVYDLDPCSGNVAALLTFIDDNCQGIIKAELRVVDDHHALIICPNTATATRLLELYKPRYKLRPFAQASAASQQISSVELLPPRARPKTTAAVAKRFLSHALGMPGLRDRGAEQALAAQRKDAKDERRAKLVAQEEVWGADD